MWSLTARPPLLRRAFFITILALAAFVRFYCLTCSSLWHDEGNSWALAQRGFQQIAREAAADIHPPGYYWLLKVWAGPFGYSAWGMRSLSTVAGVLMVAVIYLAAREIGKVSERDGGIAGDRFLFPHLAALLAALNPFQVYFAHEARMYALLALESTVLMWALLAMQRRASAGSRNASVIGYAALYTVAAAAGLWTHYFFGVIWAASVGAAFWWRLGLGRGSGPAEVAPLRQSPDGHGAPEKGRPFLIFLGLNALALLAFLPWLPTGVDRLLNWPSQDGYVDAEGALRLALQTLATGTIRSAPRLAWGWLLLVGLLPVCGLWRLRRTYAGKALLLWILLPLAVMFGFGLFNSSFLKFLLAASPAWCIASAASPHCLADGYTSMRQLKWFGRGPHKAENPRLNRRLKVLSSLSAAGVAGLAAALAAITLPAYYIDPGARDNYAGIAQTVAALADPIEDLVILNAQGQADVWSYYDVKVDALPLPVDRPPDRAKTEETLERETTDRDRIFAIYWATEQSDSEGIVESWLGRNAFKGLESWQGNLRFATYSMPREQSCAALNQPHRFDGAVELYKVCLSPQPLAGGDTLQVGLRWRSLASPGRQFKVTVQMLNDRNQVVVQRDGEPGAGTLPATDWQKGDVVADNHGLPLPPGTPPGRYRLIVALYDPENGVRLATPSGDAAEIAQPVLERPDQPIPLSIVPMQRRSDLVLGRVTLVGHDFHRKTFGHAPATALSSGDVLQVHLYWQAPTPLPSDWPDDMTMRLLLGDQAVESPLAGGSYPTTRWRQGELVRSIFEIPFDGTDATLWLEVEGSRTRLGRIPLAN